MRARSRRIIWSCRRRRACDPRQPARAASDAAQTSARQVRSPGSGPLTCTRRHDSPKVGSARLQGSVQRRIDPASASRPDAVTSFRLSACRRRRCRTAARVTGNSSPSRPVLGGTHHRCEREAAGRDLVFGASHPRTTPVSSESREPHARRLVSRLRFGLGCETRSVEGSAIWGCALTESVRFTSRGLSCAADLYLPEGVSARAPLPALVLGHGFGGLKDGLVAQSEYFRRAGYVVLTIDSLLRRERRRAAWSALPARAGGGYAQRDQLRAATRGGGPATHWAVGYQLRRRHRDLYRGSWTAGYGRWCHRCRL